MSQFHASSRSVVNGNSAVVGEPIAVDDVQRGRDSGRLQVARRCDVIDHSAGVEIASGYDVQLVERSLERIENILGGATPWYALVEVPSDNEWILSSTDYRSE